MRNYSNKNTWFVLVFSIILISCDHKFTSSLFKAKSAHQLYEEQLKDAGLEGTIMFKKWVDAAERSLHSPIMISVPYQEMAYFSSQNPNAMGYLFEARNGEQIQIKISQQSLDSTRIFIDLFEKEQDSTMKRKHLRSTEKDSTTLQFIIKNDGKYVLRIQPELLSDISFDLRITAEPSLFNPVAKDAKQNIGSFFGMERDAGARKHEGIDIFADRLTPVLAAADGMISRVGTNRLGGKIVTLKPKNRSIRLYYAHLDSQTVNTGQSVTIGDTVGLMGNTGNARTTPPHLHFGIYTTRGAIDPLPFVRPGKSSPPQIMADVKRIGDTVRTLLNNEKVPTPVLIEAAAVNGYRVMTPNKSKLFVLESQVTPFSQDLNSVTLNKATKVYSEPNFLAAMIIEYPPGKKVQVIGKFNNFQLVMNDFIKGWIPSD